MLVWKIMQNTEKIGKKMQNETRYLTKITEDSSEDAHQMRLFEWANQQKDKPVLQSKLFFAIVNENKVCGKGGSITGAKHKAMGKKAGVADVMLAYPNHMFHGLFLELKRPGGKQSEEQKVFQQQVEAVGYRYKLCFSWLDASQAILEYLRYV